MMQYLVRTDQPFRGSVQSVVLENGTVAYSDGQTVAEYIADRGGNLRVVTEAELFELVQAYEASLVTEPRQITAEQWDDALNVLPPCRWHTFDGVQLFHVSERITGGLVDWYATTGGRDNLRCWHFVDLHRRPSAELAAKVRRAAESVPA